ncbi:hypothetical protein KEH51_02420 [[Brevibacterium] frigoritolerans]|uniref:Uncharacterized protein n=1 Tax=Peribacillus frigoritolerans TaxID=450367 RepID=A0A941FPD6_9BACI|nr:hypothetical protein [Peribacillus frigoritolerans]
MIGKLNILLFLLLCIHQSLNRLKKFATILPNNCLPSRFDAARQTVMEKERISEIIWNIF